MKKLLNFLPTHFTICLIVGIVLQFQCQIWQHLKSIPYGNTVSYGALGATLSTSARAIGGACGANPIPLLIPCHRIVGQDGHLTGYSGGNGLQTKKQLLVLEKRYLNNSRSAPTQ